MLDYFLAFLLLVVVPLAALLRSRYRQSRGERKAVRYLTTIATVAILLGMLTASWANSGRSVQSLGLGIPDIVPAFVGLPLAGALLLALWLAIGRQTKSAEPHAIRQMSELLPGTQHELRLYLLLSIAVGFGWEVLYRGFLMFFLPPITGLPVAVLISALAYGAAHGFTSVKQSLGSVFMALVFTGAYLLTQNLWCLILLHVGLPLLSLKTRQSVMQSEPTG